MDVWTRVGAGGRGRVIDANGIHTFTFPVSSIVLDLQKYLDQGVRVKLQGGREVRGVLKGFDPLVNVVLDECIEFIRGEIALRPAVTPSGDCLLLVRRAR